jgi:hypothetical protein
VLPGSPGLPREVFVSGGAIVVSEADGTQRRLTDEGRALERWLIEVGAADLAPDVLSIVRDDLER